MRSFLLSLPIKLQLIFIVGITMLVAFSVALFSSTFFDITHLRINIDLISCVYQVMGTIYAILLTFTLWGVWQSYTQADASVQNETFALLDLVHMVETTSQWTNLHIREAAYKYVEGVVNSEWESMKNITNTLINIREQNHAASMTIVKSIQSIQPDAGKDMTIFSHVLTLLDKWLDSRRSRILMARGNSAKALWPLLLVGSLVLFSFHGLFAAASVGIWTTLLAGTALVIGLTFYLIFTFDCPFSGSPSVDSEPFKLALRILGLNEHWTESINVPKSDGVKI